MVWHHCSWPQWRTDHKLLVPSAECILSQWRAGTFFSTRDDKNELWRNDLMSIRSLSAKLKPLLPIDEWLPMLICYYELLLPEFVSPEGLKLIMWGPFLKLLLAGDAHPWSESILSVCVKHTIVKKKKQTSPSKDNLGCPPFFFIKKENSHCYLTQKQYCHLVSHLLIHAHSLHHMAMWGGGGHRLNGRLLQSHD